ncbi:MAG: HAD-IA family hydrolase, partial [Promethearchaeota archaeon]
ESKSNYNLKQIKTIIFDLGGVIFTDGSMLAIKKIINALHLNKCDSDIIERCFSNEPGDIGRKIRLGLISYKQFEDELASRLGLFKSKKKKMLRHLWFSSYVPNFLMRKIIKKLSKRYRLIIFSGNVQKRIEYLKKRFKIFKYFDDEIYSYDYQMNKRDIELYEELLNHINCNPSEALLIDDGINNIKRAESVGLHGIHYTYTEKLVEDLREFGIEIRIKY